MRLSAVVFSVIDKTDLLNSTIYDFTARELRFSNDAIDH